MIKPPLRACSLEHVHSSNDFSHSLKFYYDSLVHHYRYVRTQFSFASITFQNGARAPLHSKEHKIMSCFVMFESGILAHWISYISLRNTKDSFLRSYVCCMQTYLRALKSTCADASCRDSGCI